MKEKMEEKESQEKHKNVKTGEKCIKGEEDKKTQKRKP
jgi:hypothetical protein